MPVRLSLAVVLLACWAVLSQAHEAHLPRAATPKQSHVDESGTEGHGGKRPAVCDSPDGLAADGTCRAPAAVANAPAPSFLQGLLGRWTFSTARRQAHARVALAALSLRPLCAGAETSAVVSQALAAAWPTMRHTGVSGAVGYACGLVIRVRWRTGRRRGQAGPTREGVCRRKRRARCSACRLSLAARPPARPPTTARHADAYPRRRHPDYRGPGTRPAPTGLA
jgi:hypothetical protein